MKKPLMPLGTAVWLTEHTALTFTQIAAFVSMHELEVKAIADGEIGASVSGWNPIANGQLAQDDIDACEADQSRRLVLIEDQAVVKKPKRRQVRYTPIAKRFDKVNAIAWLLRNHKSMTIAQVCKLAGSNKTTVKAIATGTHWNSVNIQPVHPVEIGICHRQDYEDIVDLVRKQAEADEAKSSSQDDGGKKAST